MKRGLFVKFYCTKKQLAEKQEMNFLFEEVEDKENFLKPDVDEPDVAVFNLFTVRTGEDWQIVRNARCDLVSEKNPNRQETKLTLVTEGLSQVEINKAIYKMQRQLDKYSKKSKEAPFIKLDNSKGY